MIQMQSNLDVADNSGAKRVQCIKVLGGSKRRTATVGDIIVVSVKEAVPRGKVKNGDVHRAVIVRTAKDIHRADGSTIRFDSNAAVLVNKNEEPIHVSKVAIADPKSGKATRVRFETRDGKKVRVAVKSGELING